MKAVELGIALLLAICLTGAQACFRNASTASLVWPTISIQVLGWLACALALYMIVFVAYAYALRSISISFLFPVYTGLSVVLVFLLGALLFGEKISVKSVAGCVLIVTGIVFMSSAQRTVNDQPPKTAGGDRVEQESTQKEG
ncbi:MAG: Multidrug resistance protein EbrB [Firmicutes bacterium]|nr:Multidrug resistance protein EbrB [Bacillota bacterium]